MGAQGEVGFWTWWLLSRLVFLGFAVWCACILGFVGFTTLMVLWCVGGCFGLNHVFSVLNVVYILWLVCRFLMCGCYFPATVVF